MPSAPRRSPFMFRPCRSPPGAAGGVLAAIVSIWWTLRSLARVSERSLLAGNSTAIVGAPRSTAGPQQGRHSAGRARTVGARPALTGPGADGRGLDETGAFFGAGASLLAACLCAA